MIVKYFIMLILAACMGITAFIMTFSTSCCRPTMWISKILYHLYNSDLNIEPYQIYNTIITPYNILPYNYSALTNLSFQRQLKDCIYLYMEDLPVYEYDLSQGISFGYGGDKKKCFSDDFCDFEKNYERNQLLGKGNFGEVWEITTKCCGSKYALKIGKPMVSTFYSNIGYYNPELYFAKYFQLNPLPHIIKSYHVYFDTGDFYIISEVLKHKNIIGLVFLDDTYDQKKLDKYIQGIFIAIVSLHKNKIVHGDIKPDNIGIDENHNIKIFDFGFSNKFDSGYINMCQKAGTPFFMPPEYLDFKTNISYQTDWWAFGVVLYVLVENYYPYGSPGYGPKNVCRNLKYCMKKKQFRNFTNNKLSEELKDLIRKLLEPEIENRLGVGEDPINDILSHPYFKGKNYKKIIEKVLKLK